MRLVVVGAGGLGASLATQLNGEGREVTVVARGAHLAAIQEDGLRLRHGLDERRYSVRAVPEVPEGGDVYFVAVKAFSLDPLIPRLARVAELGGTIVPLLNGVDAGPRLLGGGVPAEFLVEGIAYLTGFLRGPGIVERIGSHGKVVLGGMASKDRIEAVGIALSSSGLDVEISSDIEVLLWRKMGVVCTLNAACVLFDGGLGKARHHPYGAPLIAGAAREVLAVAHMRGIDLPGEEFTEITRAVAAFEDDFYPSMLHDLRSGKRTEIDSLNGALTRLARQSGSVARIHDAVTAVIRSRGAV